MSAFDGKALADVARYHAREAHNLIAMASKVSEDDPAGLAKVEAAHRAATAYAVVSIAHSLLGGDA